MAVKNQGTFLAQAKSFASSTHTAAAAIAMVPLAAAPTAQAASLTINPGTVDAQNVDVIFGSGSPTGTGLSASAGNATDMVSLTGDGQFPQMKGDAFFNTADLVFTNTGTVTALAGESIQVDADFDLFFDASGGSPDVAYVFELAVDGEVTQTVGGIATVDGPFVTQSFSDTLTFAPFSTDLTDADLTLTLTTSWPQLVFGITYAEISVDVPQGSSSIDLTVLPATVVPVPATAWMGLGLLAGLGGMRTIKRRGA